MNLRRTSTWLWLIGLFGAIGLLSFGHFYLDDLAREHYGTGPRRFMEEMTGAYTALTVVPIVAWILRRFPWCWDRLPLVIAVNLVGIAVFSVVHTTLMLLTRMAISPLVGLGPYDYGIMRIRYPMEAANDVIVYLTVMLGVLFIAHLGKVRRAELAAADLQTKLAETKLDNLRLQLQPHFLFNTLNAISSVMYENVRKADEMLSKLSDFLRVVLASGGVHEVPLTEELAVERMYLDIMRTRLERNLTLDVNVDPKAERGIVPFMLLQPLLENSIRHGMGDERTAMAMEINVRRENGAMLIDVCDNGRGVPPTIKGGIGLNNVRSRLEHMYGSAASFSIAPRKEGGTCATIALPFTAGNSL
ncbi:MAG: histidine kinase [Candidatus Eremiobacteraeota bacterium]|nr:histidine kinase [Candidatus Eremiobacteraeota bacterium]